MQFPKDDQRQRFLEECLFPDEIGRRDLTSVSGRIFRLHIDYIPTPACHVGDIDDSSSVLEHVPSAGIDLG